MYSLTDSARLTRQIANVTAHKERATLIVQEVAIQCIGYSVIHGDIMHGVRLLNGVSKHQKGALVAFFEKEGNFAWDKAGKTFVFKPTFTAESFDQSRADALSKGKVWEKYSKPATIVSTYDVQDQVRKLLRSYEIAVEAGKVIENAELIDMVSEVNAKFSGMMQDRTTA
jgi:hypothetical protein